MISESSDIVEDLRGCDCMCVPSDPSCSLVERRSLSSKEVWGSMGERVDLQDWKLSWCNKRGMSMQRPRSRVPRVVEVCPGMGEEALAP